MSPLYKDIIISITIVIVIIHSGTAFEHHRSWISIKGDLQTVVFKEASGGLVLNELATKWAWGLWSKAPQDVKGNLKKNWKFCITTDKQWQLELQIMLPGKAGNEVKGVLISIWIIFRVWLEYYILPDTLSLSSSMIEFSPLWGGRSFSSPTIIYLQYLLVFTKCNKI